MNNIEQLIKEFISREFLNDKPHVALDGNLVEQGVIDSLGIMTLIVYVEKQFGARIKPEDVVPENFESVAAIARLVTQRIVA